MLLKFTKKHISGITLNVCADIYKDKESLIIN